MEMTWSFAHSRSFPPPDDRCIDRSLVSACSQSKRAVPWADRQGQVPAAASAAKLNSLAGPKELFPLPRFTADLNPQADAATPGDGGAAQPECLELPRPKALLRTIGWNVAESFGLPTGAYAIAGALAGRNAGLWAMLGVIWLTAVIRKLATGSVPGLVTISLVVLTVQTLAAIITGNVWIFLLHFPLANLALCVLFVRTARGNSPIAARLAAEVIGLRCPGVYQQRMHRFFQNVTALWGGVFLLLAVSLGALLATVPVTTYVPVWAITTITLIALGIGASTLWLRSVTRRLGIGFRFA
jgi:hypothetical protein